MAASLLRPLRISQILSGCCNSFLNGRKLMSTSAPITSPSLILPPPAFGGGYKFYSLKEKRLVTAGGGGGSGGEFELVGSSHGWLALFNPRNNDLLLSNPLSGRRIQLPRIEILGDPEDNLKVIVLKVILSSAPDEQGCRAMMAYSRASMSGGSKVAFCSLGRSWRWTQISNMCDYISYTFEDLVYCSSRKVLSCITPVKFDPEIYTRHEASLLVNWDIGNPLMDDWNMGKPEIAYWEIACPSRSQWGVQEALSFRKARRQEKGKTQSWMENLMEHHHHCTQIPHLVYAEEFDQLYLATRFVSSGGQTLGFVLLKVRRNGTYEVVVVDDLNGLVMFVGINDSIAVPASRFPQLIYFTHVKRIKVMKMGFPRTNDTGVFDYESKTITPIITGDDPHQSSPIRFYPPPDTVM